MLTARLPAQGITRGLEATYPALADVAMGYRFLVRSPNGWMSRLSWSYYRLSFKIMEELLRHHRDHLRRTVIQHCDLEKGLRTPMLTRDPFVFSFHANRFQLRCHHQSTISIRQLQQFRCRQTPFRAHHLIRRLQLNPERPFPSPQYIDRIPRQSHRKLPHLNAAHYLK